MLAVSDQGAGMDEQTRSRLFEPFFTTKEKGTGLGLSTVYGIVKQNGGEIWVYSEPGFGSTFKIYLPRVSATGDRDDPDQTIETATAPTETILLVEDEPGVRKLVREMLARRGYTVLAPENSADALAIGKKHRGPIHLLLTDVVMPNLGGRELARRLGQSRPAMKVLYMSGYTDAAVVHNGVIEPGAAFLQKPFTAELLERKIREVLDADAHTA
jgi:CheY-like chemotaxis protein